MTGKSPPANEGITVSYARKKGLAPEFRVVHKIIEAFRQLKRFMRCEAFASQDIGGLF